MAQGLAKAEKIKKREAGFSLIEVVVASAILAIVSLILAQVAALQRKVLSTSEAGFDTLDLVNQIRAALSEPESCKKTLSGAHLAGESVSKIVRAAYDLSTSSWVYSTLAEVGVPFSNNLVISKMRFTSPASFNGTGTLEVWIDRTKTGVMGGVTVLRSIPLIIKQEQPNLIKVGECFAPAAGSTSPSGICESLGGTFNASTGKCENLANALIDSTEVVCFSGNKASLVVVDGKIKIQCTP